MGQIPNVIRERDARYLNLPMLCVTLINAMIWTGYAILQKDIPLFMTNLIAFCSMVVNMTFYLWAKQLIETSSI